MGRNTTASHYADVNLAVSEEPKQKEKDAGRKGGRESNRERAEVVGETNAHNMLSLCKTDRKVVIRVKLLQRRREQHAEIESYVVRGDENLVSGDQNKELIKVESSSLAERSLSVTDVLCLDIN